jgi:hypothetical protein
LKDNPPSSDYNTQNSTIHLIFCLVAEAPGVNVTTIHLESSEANFIVEARSQDKEDPPFEHWTFPSTKEQFEGRRRLASKSDHVFFFPR